MSRFSLLILVFTIFYGHASGQPPRYEISNLKLDVSHNKLLIHYDFSAKGTTDPTIVNLYFYDQNYHFIKPRFISPDAKTLIAPGEKRQIEWDVTAEMKNLQSDITPLLIAGNPTKHRFGAGPEAGLLSLAIPGLGDYFVNNTRNQIIKPYIRTIAAYGLIYAGMIASRDRVRGQPSYTSDGGIWKMGDYEYKYFKGDAEFLISLGLAVWVADIIYVVIKGHRNAALKKGVFRLSGIAY
jgi:hypothetical protein